MSFRHGLLLGAFKLATGKTNYRSLLLEWESVKNTLASLAFANSLFGVDSHLSYCYDILVTLLLPIFSWFLCNLHVQGQAFANDSSLRFKVAESAGCMACIHRALKISLYVTYAVCP